MRIGRVYGIEIHMNNGFLALIGLFFIAGVLGKGLIAFSIVLLHEFAHVTAARRLGVNVTDIELLPFGGVSRLGGEMVIDPSKEVLVAAAGPATNLLLAGIATAIRTNGLWEGELLSFFQQCNIMVASFNMLPALPLDGGRVFRAYLAKRQGFRPATHRAAWWGQFWGAFIVLGATAGLAAGITGLDILVTGLFLFYAATREKSLAPYHFIRHLAMKKEELTFAGVLPGEPIVSLDTVRLGNVIQAFVPKRFHLVLVLDQNWRCRGLLSEDQIIDALLTNGVDVPLGNLIEEK